MIFQCLNAEPEEVVERLLDATDNLRSRAPSAVSFPSSFSNNNFATVQPRSGASSLRGSITSNREHYRKPIPFQVPKLPETKPESLGREKTDIWKYLEVLFHWKDSTNQVLFTIILRTKSRKTQFC